MAKKATASVQEVIEETMVVEQPMVETKKVESPKAPVKPEWEIKDRTYYLRGAHSPLTFTLASRHTSKYPLLWFDNATGEQKEIRYATNQNSPFVDEQKGEATLGHVMFTNGTLFVPKEKQNLQKLLSLYHPGLNKKYAEFDAVLVAEDELDDLDIQIDALVAAREIDVDQAEAI